MARILYTAVVADMRNKLNGSVFSKNRYGAYVRTKVSPSQPDTPAQTGIRSLFGSNSSSWRGLTEAQRNAWISAAPDYPMTDQFGNRHVLSGNALYNKLNTVLGAYSFTLVTDPPAAEFATDFKIDSFDVTNTPALVRVHMLNGGTNTNDSIIIYATPPFSAGQNYFKNKLRFLLVGPNAVAGAQVVTFTTEYAAKFGDPIIGKKIGIGVMYVNTATGQRSPMQTIEVLVAS